jgi:hypothetical protein
VSTYSTHTTRNNLHVEARSLALVHMVKGWHCPCGRILRPTDVEVTCAGLQLTCARCHKSLLDVELP